MLDSGSIGELRMSLVKKESRDRGWHREWDEFRKPIFPYRHQLLVDLDDIDPDFANFRPVSRWWLKQETPTKIVVMFKKEEDLILFKLSAI